ncbi:hypothetical protein B0H34DRAFT_783017 [Crassisporium funariophilum]|nr:hypothetical protein B0H34DRAFT_783017 [Crassisporium funariophilum]
MSVPTFDQMRKCITPIWQNEDYQTDILWAGVFGSVARNRAHEESDVDILIVLKEHERSGEPVDLRENLAEACGREISLMCIWQGPDWAWGHVRLEALLSSRSVYGNRRDVEHLRREAMAYLDDGLKRLDLIAEAVEKIKNQVTSVQTYEDFIHPAQQAARQECVQELRTVVKLLDIHPLHHPIRTMLISLSFEYADQIRALLDQDPPDINAGAAPVWRTIWDHLQPTSATMWAFDAGCAVGGRNYIRHILASKRLADRFEEGGQVDESMYREIVR